MSTPEIEGYVALAFSSGGAAYSADHFQKGQVRRGAAWAALALVLAIRAALLFNSLREVL